MNWCLYTINNVDFMRPFFFLIANLLAPIIVHMTRMYHYSCSRIDWLPEPVSSYPALIPPL